MLIAFVLFMSSAAVTPDAVAQPPETDVPALLTEADSLYRQRTYSLAARAYEQALDGAETAGDPDLETKALLGLGRTYIVTGRVEESLAILERALLVAKRRGDRADQVRILQNLGIARHDLARHTLAIEAYERALDLARELGDRSAEGQLWNNVASVRYRQGDYTGALVALAEARSRIPPDTPEYARVLTNIGRSHLYLGQYSEALSFYEEARALSGRFDDRHLEGLVWDRLANLYERTGQYDRAWEANSKALAIAREIGLRQGESATLENLGILRKRAGDLASALEYLDQARRIQLADRDETGAGTTLNHIADIFRLQGDLAEALTTYHEALAIDRRAGQRGQAGTSRLGLSDVLLDLGEPTAALAQADTVLIVAEEIHHAELAAQAEQRRARALLALGEDDQALEALYAAVDRIERLRTELTTDPAKIGFLEARQEPFHALVDLLVDHGRALQALTVAERARGRAFLDLLAGRVILEEGRAEAALAPVRRAEDELRNAVGTPDPAGVTGLGSLLALRAADALEAEIADLAETDQDLASLVSVQALTGGEIQALARAESVTFVEYLVTDRALVIWVVTPDERVLAHREPIGRSALRELVQRVRATWEGGLTTGLGPETDAAADLAELHERLIAPVARWLPADPESPVVVVPHDVLFLLPFAALRDAAGRTLIERHTLAYAPAVSVLKWLGDEDGPGTQGTQARWLGVGDPTPPGETGLARLPWAEREVRQVAARFPPRERRLLVGGQATEAAVRELLPHYDVVHLATHGVVSDDEPLASALIFTPGAGHDGYLRTPEIFSLDLDADLVVLSGCSTGLGKLSGDGILGLSRAFLFAGTPAILVSQWDVSDRATAELMERFYAARFGSGRGAAAALREAQLAILERYRHPYLWAAFELVGRAR
ncbi:MAG TPA: CHAT domain-containing tetratricopeptide repeat protein [Gemmatimonadota bacterium]|nr:CHAT domain-containing tetratricopeptide repeat protein [Gemmatimonadota bacterium]